MTVGIPVRQGGNGRPVTEAQAVRYANRIVREAHSSNVEAARSMVMNNQSEAVKMFTALYGFMNKSYGQQLDGFDKLRTAGIDNTPVLARTFMAIIVPALWAAYLSRDGADTDKGQSWAGWTAKAIGAEVAASVPLVRDAVSMVEGYKNAGMVSAENWLATMVSASKSTYKAATDPETKGHWLRDTANAAGMGLHIPASSALRRSVPSGRPQGKEQPQSAVEVAKGVITGARQSPKVTCGPRAKARAGRRRPPPNPPRRGRRQAGVVEGCRLAVHRLGARCP